MEMLTAALGSLLLLTALTTAPRTALAGQPTNPAAPTAPPEPVAPALPPSNDPLAQPPEAAPPPQQEPYSDPAYEATRAPQVPRVPEDDVEPMSEGRRIVVAYNTGFQWGISPGVILGKEKTSFFLGLRLGYGFDTGKVIIVPGVRLTGYFTDPNVYVGMPVVKLVYPIDRFAPFVEGGAGYGHISSFDVGKTSVPAESGLALFGGAGFMIHFSWKFGLGVEGTYQTITGTEFSGFGIGPIIALAF